jgi:hypothetical protein
MMMNLMMKMEKKMKVTLNLEIVTHLKEISWSLQRVTKIVENISQMILRKMES